VQQPEPQTPAAPKPAREQDTSIALAKVRPVLIGPMATTKPTFAFAGAAAATGLSRTPAGPGLAPSTLDAQAAELESNAPAPQAVASLSPREEPATKGNGKTARGPFEIQIGAYADSDDAERHMAAARERANGKLDHYRGIAMPVKNGSNQLYRARFRGFDATAANDACAQLKRAQIDCFVLKTE
jgi:D-alanyl-D-alanine carboxypeptidase